MAVRKDRTSEIIRRNLVRFREEAGYSQAIAAYQSGVPIHSIRHYEQGRNSLDAQALLKLANCYGHATDDFYMEEPPPAEESRKPVFRLVLRPDATPDPELLDEGLAFLDRLNDKQRQIDAQGHSKPNVKPRKRD